jgi:Ca2+-transporting ATPase
MSREFYTLSREGALQELRSDMHQGLSAEEAARRLETYGRNELAGKPPVPLWKRFLNQFKDFLVIILLISAVIAGLLGEIVDAVAIMAIVILNAILSLVQEGRAEQALAALKKLTIPISTVIRDGKTVRVPSPELVPGDIIVLSAGDLIPADMRLLESVNLKIDESPLTGESVPVDKHAEKTIEPGATVGDRINSAHLGTTVSYGRGLGLITGTGMKTELGKIAEMVASVDEESTPLQEKLAEFGKWLGIACLGICALIFVLEFIREGISDLIADPHRLVELFMTAVALAVAAIPEGLPAVVTIVLALGMQRMANRNAIIRRLPAVETLGCATHICSDKTGTLTENKMNVRQIFLADGTDIEVTGQGYKPEGEFLVGGKPFNAAREDVQWIFKISAGCNDAGLVKKDTPQGEVYTIVGDPTEGALVTAAAKGTVNKEAFDKEYPRLSEVPFDSSRKRMTTVHKFGDHVYALSKGAPDLLLALCTKYLEQNEEHYMDDRKRSEYIDKISEMAAKGLRVLGFAYRNVDQGIPEEGSELERDLVFVGLAGMIDPVRPEVKEAVQTCRHAGITPIMVTGDYALTARAIGEELGMTSENSRVISGAELESMSDAELDAAVKETSVFARVSPEHKLRIVDALRRQDRIVAMTGDGVNDAPALRKADIGVAMGITGTDVAKEASDMVLTDDNFASIVAAVGEGRAIFENIRKSVIYLLSCNVGELLLFFIAILMQLPPPLVAVQILMVNLVTDGLPALALGVDPPEKGLMNLPPRDVHSGIISRPVIIRLSIVGLLVAVSTLSTFLIFYNPNDLSTLTLAETGAFLTMCLGELWRSLSNRSERLTSFQMPLFSNKRLIQAIVGSLVIVGIIMAVPVIRENVFEMTLPNLSQWGIILAISLIPFLGAELLKILKIAPPDRR